MNHLMYHHSRKKRVKFDAYYYYQLNFGNDISQDKLRSTVHCRRFFPSIYLYSLAQRYHDMCCIHCTIHSVCLLVGRSETNHSSHETYTLTTIHRGEYHTLKFLNFRMWLKIKVKQQFYRILKFPNIYFSLQEILV